MVLRVPISAKTAAKLKARAREVGVDLETYVAQHLEAVAAPPKSLKEISGPIGEEFEASRMGEDELADFIEKEIHTMRAERRAKRQQ